MFQTLWKPSGIAPAIELATSPKADLIRQSPGRHSA
jgi:hypothetical protein